MISFGGRPVQVKASFGSARQEQDSPGKRRATLAQVGRRRVPAFY